jgi:hypothetical protein
MDMEPACRAQESSFVVDRSTPSAHRWLVASPESVDAATGCLTARRQGRTRTGAAVVIRRDEHLHRGTPLVLLAARYQCRGCPFSHALSEDSWRVLNLGYERIHQLADFQRWSRCTRRPLVAEVVTDFGCRVDKGQEGYWRPALGVP